MAALAPSSKVTIEVIAFNWVAQSSTPGAAVKPGSPRLTTMILDASRKVPADEPVDLQFIGHSEGTVVNTQAIVRVEAANVTPRIKAGYPRRHPARPARRQSRFPWPASTARADSIRLDRQARDRQFSGQAPATRSFFIPKGVDSAQVFYQQTPGQPRPRDELRAIYNLWGQVPVKGTAILLQLDLGADVVHSGKHGVYAWYEHHIVPTLGDGAPQLATEAVTGSIATTAASTSSADRATYTGTSAPGSTVLLMAGIGHGRLSQVGEALAGADGTWTATTKPLAAGS